MRNKFLYCSDSLSDIDYNEVCDYVKTLGAGLDMALQTVIRIITNLSKEAIITMLCYRDLFNLA